MSLFVRRVLRASVAAGVATAAAHECSRLSKCESPRSTAPPLRLPSIGLGLWKSAPGEVHNAVKEALLFGCRLLDGAAAYGNEKEVGGAIAESIAVRVVRREDLWIVSKLFNTHHVWDGDTSRPAAALDATLRDLGVDQLDLYLMHWPVAIEQLDLKALGGLRLADGTPNPKLTMRTEFLETWREMIALKKTGKVRHLGVCNFTLEQLQALLAAYPDEPPAVNQVELHPYLCQPELVAYCKQHGIAMMAYSPLGSSDSYSGKSFPAVGDAPFENPRAGAPLLQNELVRSLADKHGATPAQVLIAWSVAKGFCCLPKSVQAHRIAQNLGACDACALSADDVTELDSLNCGWRYGIGYFAGYFDCPNAPWYSGKGGSSSTESLSSHRKLVPTASEKLGLSKPS